MGENLWVSNIFNDRLLLSCIGIGDLIIDLDADIEKSSSTNLETALVIPLQSSANLSSDRVSAVDNKSQDLAESKVLSAKTIVKGKYFNWLTQFWLIILLKNRQKRADNNVFDNKLWN